MPTKPLLKNYPQHAEFEELLNSCGSMTQQLENLGKQLSVKLIHEGIEGEYFCRYSLLHLNNRAVVIACSQAHLSAEFFCQLLKNANVIPIGKFLFAAGSQVQRNNAMDIKLVSSAQISKLQLQQYLNQNYRNNQEFWQRTSQFNYRNEQLNLIEIILPEFEEFFSSTNSAI